MIDYGDPFARPNQQPTKVIDLGMTSNIDDNIEAERASMKDMIPSEATTDSGFNTMMNILNAQKRADQENRTSPLTQNIPSSQSSNGHYEPPKVEGAGFLGADSPTYSYTPTPSSLFEGPGTQDITEATPKGKEEEKKVDYKDEDLLPILDSILTSGYASDTFYIRNNRVTLRTQFFWEDQYVMIKTDELANSTNLRQSMGFYMQVYALASNLESLGGTSFPVKRSMSKEEQEKSFNDRVEFLLSLPTVLVGVIFNKRTEFVNKIQYIQDNFDRLIKVF